MWDEIIIHCQTSTGQPLKFVNGWIISSHTLLGMWLLIHPQTVFFFLFRFTPSLGLTLGTGQMLKRLPFLWRMNLWVHFTATSFERLHQQSDYLFNCLLRHTTKNSTNFDLAVFWNGNPSTICIFPAHTRVKRLHGPFTRYVTLRVAHAPGMPGTFSPATEFKGNRLLAIPVCITARASRTCRDACRDRLPALAGKTFPVFPAHAHPHFYVSGKRPISWRRHDLAKITFIPLRLHMPVPTYCIIIVDVAQRNKIQSNLHYNTTILY